MLKIPLSRLLSAVGLLLPLSLGAQEHVAQLDPIVVTPTLSARTVDDSLSSVSVVESETIRRQQPREITDILRGRPGVDVVGNGPYGKNASLYLRGTGAEQTLLLVDGIRLGSATSGGPAWQFLPPQLIDRVEIVRGPRASLYGADAVGGVVQVFTPEESGAPRPWVTAGAGSFNSHELGAGVAGGEGGTRYALGVNRFDTDGIALREGGERKGYDNTSGALRLSHTFESGVDLGVIGLRAQGNTEYQSGVTDFVNQAAGAKAALPLGRIWYTEVSLGESRDEADNTEAGTETRFDTLRRMASLQNTVLLGRHELIFGGDFRRDRVESTTDYDEDRRDNTGAFGQLFVDGGRVDYQASLRWDDNEAYGEEVTGAVALGIDVDARHRVRLSHGTAFRAPTFNDLYFPGFGNPDVRPESSATTEVGLRGNYRRWYWDAAVYQTDVDDLILTVCDASFNCAPENVAEARIRGLELGTGAELGPWTLYAAATLTDPRDTDTDNRLRRRSGKSLRLEVDRQFGSVSVGGTVIAQGDRYDDADNQIRLAGFGLLNLRTDWEFAPDWTLRLTVDNVFDKDYVVARDSFNDFDYQQPGRNAFLSVNYGSR